MYCIDIIFFFDLSLIKKISLNDESYWFQPFRTFYSLTYYVYISETIYFRSWFQSFLLHMSTGVGYSKISTIFLYIAQLHSLRYHTGHARHAHWDIFVHILLTTEIIRFFVSFLQFSFIDNKYTSMYNTMTHLYILIFVTFFTVRYL